MGIASSGPVLEDPLYTASSGPLVLVDDPLYISQHGANRFSEEKSIQYRVGNRGCTFHASAHNENNLCDKISFVLNDYCDDDDEVRVDLCVGSEKDNNRSLRFGLITVTCQGPNVELGQCGENSKYISYGCFLREGLMIIKRLDEETLLVGHSYFVDRDQCLNFMMGIGCDRRTGLWFTIERPFEDARNLRTMLDLHSDRVQSLRQGLDSVNIASRLHYALMVLQGSTNGLINNLGRTTNGNYNGSFNINYYYCDRDEVRRN